MLIAWAVLLEFGTFGCVSLPSSAAERKHESAGQAQCLEEALRQRLDILWVAYQQQMSVELKASLGAGNLTALYNLQLQTSSLLRYAQECGDYSKLSELAKLYLVPLDYRTITSTSIVPMGGSIESVALSRPTAIWVNGDKSEATHPNAYFAYLMAKSLNVFLALPPSVLSTPIRRFITDYREVVLERYMRWLFGDGLFQVNGWGCGPRRLNHKEFIEHKLGMDFGDQSGTSYCNAVTDDDLVLIAGASELLKANELSSADFVLSADHRRRLLAYVSLGSQLIESRTTSTRLVDFEGRDTFGIDFDAGAWRDHPEYQYAGYEGVSFPEPTQVARVKGIGWDLAHAGIIGQVLETLHDNRSATLQAFPDLRVLAGFTNQITFRVFNRQIRTPGFTNFIDGSNGWYRVNYAERPGFGYGPGDLSIGFMRGGYSFLKKYNADLGRLVAAEWVMLSSTDPEITAYRSSLGQYFQSGARTSGGPSDVDLLTFIPTLLTGAGSH